MAGQEEILGIEHFTPGLDSIKKIELEPLDFNAGLKPKTPPTDLPPREGLAKIQADQEKKAVEKALTAYRGNVSQAAKSLGISRQLLHYKIKKYKIFRVDFIPRPLKS